MGKYIITQFDHGMNYTSHNIGIWWQSNLFKLQVEYRTQKELTSSLKG